MKVNGIPVYVVMGSSTTLNWTVPSLGAEVVGTGPTSGQVMHTLHKA